MKAARTIRFATAMVVAGLVLPGSASAQFTTGQKWLGAHVGLSGVGSAPALGVNGEIGYRENIGIGAWVDTWSYGESFGSAAGSVSWNVRYVSLAGTGSYHFPIESNAKLDPFVGLAVGYFVVNSSTESSVTGVTYSGDASRIFLGGFGGLRYLFKENLAGLARLGFGASYLTVGVDFRM